jgi:hypothetical protein
MRIACWITKATDTHSEYLILSAFPLRQWLHERSLILRYTYIACLVLNFMTVIVHQETWCNTQKVPSEAGIIMVITRIEV